MLDGHHRNLIDGKERDGESEFTVRSPIDRDIVLGHFATRHPPGRQGRDRGRPQGAAGLVRPRLGEADRDPEARRRADQRAPDGLRRADGDRGRQEPDRGARRGRGGGRPHPLLRPDGRGQPVLRAPDGQPRRRGGPHEVDPPAARRLRRHQPVQLPDGAVVRPVGGGDAGRQHRRVQAVVGGPDLGASSCSRPIATRACPTASSTWSWARARRSARSSARTPASTGSCSPGRTTSGWTCSGRSRARYPKPTIVEMGGKNPAIVARYGGPRRGGRGDHAQRVRLRRPEVLGEQPGLRREAGPRRARPAARREDRGAHDRRPAPPRELARAGHRPEGRRPPPGRRRRRLAATGASSPAAST